MGFDEIYARVPAEQIERLKEFRSTHEYKHLLVDGAECEYISCGRGEQTLLLLPGGLSVGESAFPLVTAFEKEYRIIAPSYALSLTMTGLCDGIAHILETEGVNRAHVLGGSYGGLVAQYFVRKYPDKARSLILSHTFLMTQNSRSRCKSRTSCLAYCREAYLFRYSICGSTKYFFRPYAPPNTRSSSSGGHT